MGDEKTVVDIPPRPLLKRTGGSRVSDRTLEGDSAAMLLTSPGVNYLYLWAYP
jgi:hypothetical protein